MRRVLFLFGVYGILSDTRLEDLSPVFSRHRLICLNQNKKICS